MAHSGGGGSHGGGSHGGSHSRGRSSSSAKRSKNYFFGAYRHRYIDRKGITRTYYSSSDKVNRPSLGQILLFPIVMIAFVIFIAIADINDLVSRPMKLTDTVAEEVRVEDTIDCFTDEEERILEATLEEYFQETGVNAKVYTASNRDWKNNYISMENYAMEQYYALCKDEKHCLIVYSTEITSDNWDDWNFETVYGDDTTQPIGPMKEEYMLKQLQNNLWGNPGSPATGINQSFQDLISYSKTIHFNWRLIGTLTLFVSVVVVFLVFMLIGYRKEMDEYNYYCTHRDCVKNPLNYKTACPTCGAPNSDLDDACSYCGTVLRIR